MHSAHEATAVYRGTLTCKLHMPLGGQASRCMGTHAHVYVHICVAIETGQGHSFASARGHEPGAWNHARMHGCLHGFVDLRLCSRLLSWSRTLCDQ